MQLQRNMVGREGQEAEAEAEPFGLGNNVERRRSLAATLNKQRQMLAAVLSWSPTP